MIPLRDSAPSHRLPLVTYLLIAVNVLVFWREILSSDLEVFISQYALIPQSVSFSSVATLTPFVTSQFLHAGFVHLFSNLWFLKIFGDSIEAVWGWVRFALFYLTSGIVAGLAQYLVAPTSDIPMLGASGAVAGVLGAYLVFFPSHKIETLIPVAGFWRVVDLPAALMLFYWFITQVFSGVASLGVQSSIGGVAFFAHAGGFVFGYILAKLTRKSAPSPLSS